MRWACGTRRPTRYSICRAYSSRGVAIAAASKLHVAMSTGCQRLMAVAGHAEAAAHGRYELTLRLDEGAPRHTAYRAAYVPSCCPSYGCSRGPTPSAASVLIGIRPFCRSIDFARDAVGSPCCHTSDAVSQAMDAGEMQGCDLDSRQSDHSDDISVLILCYRTGRHGAPASAWHRSGVWASQAVRVDTLSSLQGGMVFGRRFHLRHRLSRDATECVPLMPLALLLLYPPLRIAVPCDDAALAQRLFETAYLCVLAGESERCRHLDIARFRLTSWSFSDDRDHFGCCASNGTSPSYRCTFRRQK